MKKFSADHLEPLRAAHQAQQFLNVQGAIKTLSEWEAVVQKASEFFENMPIPGCGASYGIPWYVRIDTIIEMRAAGVQGLTLDVNVPCERCCADEPSSSTNPRTQPSTSP